MVSFRALVPGRRAAVRATLPFAPLKTLPFAPLKTLPVWVLLAGALVRFWGLGRESIWLDEATSVFFARMNVPTLIAWVAADIHPPLYFLLLHFWIALGQSEFVVRALSAVFGIGSIVITYVLARELFDSRVAIVSALLLALSPLHVFYSQEARMYIMAATWSTLASYLLLLALRRQSRRYWVGYALASVLALYTHYFALFALLYMNLFALVWLWRKRAGQGLVLRCLLSGVAIAVAFLPWVPTVVQQVLGGGGGWVERSIGHPSLRALLETWLHFSVGLEGHLYPPLVRRGAYALYAGCILAAIAAAIAPRRADWQSALLGRSDRQAARPARPANTDSLFTGEGTLFCIGYVAVPLLTVWLISQVKPMYTVRYLLPFLPPYLILVASGIRALPGKWVSFAVILSLSLTLLAGDWYTFQTPQKGDWRSASAYVAGRLEPGDVALFSPRWNAKPFDYYAPGQVELDLDLPVPTTEEAAREAVSDISQRFRRVWFFWEPDHYGDPTAIARRLLDSQFQRVETREFRGVGTVILYQVAGGR